MATANPAQIPDLRTVEQIGPFRLYPPYDGNDTWSISYDGMWLPIVLADRDACLVTAGLVLAGRDELLPPLRNTYNRAQPSVPVTVDHLAAAAQGAPEPEAG